MIKDSYSEHLERVAERRKRLGDALRASYPDPVSLTLEIGCGHGHWLVDFASAHPERVCLGLDLIGDRIGRALKKAERVGLANVRFLKAEAMEALDLLPEWVDLREVFVLFPDPWPKKRHWKNRLFCGPFLSELAARVGAGTRCYFRTDHEGYFEWAREVVAGQSAWKPIGSDAWPFERVTVFQAKASAYQSLIVEKL